MNVEIWISSINDWRILYSALLLDQVPKGPGITKQAFVMPAPTPVKGGTNSPLVGFSFQHSLASRLFKVCQIYSYA